MKLSQNGFIISWFTNVITKTETKIKMTKLIFYKCVLGASVSRIHVCVGYKCVLGASVLGCMCVSDTCVCVGYKCVSGKSVCQGHEILGTTKR